MVILAHGIDEDLRYHVAVALSFIGAIVDKKRREGGLQPGNGLSCLQGLRQPTGNNKRNTP